MSTLADRMSSNTDMPFEIRKVFANAGEPHEFHRAWVLLWREVIARAVMDALGYTGQTEADRHNSILRDAQWWFKYSPDLQEIFDLAELPLKTTRDCVLENFALTKKASKVTGVVTKKKARHDKDRKADKPGRN